MVRFLKPHKPYFPGQLHEIESFDLDGKSLIEFLTEQQAAGVNISELTLLGHLLGKNRYAGQNGE